MSKSSPKPRASGPSTPQSVPNQSGTKSPKFYDGPTVSAKASELKGKAGEVRDKAKVAVVNGQVVAKKQAKKAVATVRRHPLSFGALLTTVPVVIFLSLLSVVFCPPPPAPPSIISRIALSPFGLHESSSSYSELHKTLCYPSNLYHREFLQPYIYPRLEASRQKFVSHPIYTSILEPSFESVKSTSGKVWRGPVRPIVSRLDRGARKFYLNFIEPHIPYVQKRFYTFTSPYTSKLSAEWKTHVSPRLQVLEQEIKVLWKKVSHLAHQVVSHPVSKNAVVYGDKGSKLLAARSRSAYVWAKPRAVGIAKAAEKVARDVLGPRAMKALDFASQQVAKGWVLVKQRIAHLYQIHLEPHVGHYITKASTVASPYVSTIQSKVYTPYILPVITHYFPTTPEKPVTFWSFISDKLPGLSNIAESKNGFVPTDSKAKPKKTSPDGKEKIDRAEAERVRNAIKEKIAKQGRKGYDKVQEELVKLNTEWLSQSFPQIEFSAKDSLDRDINHLLTGLDKLYTASTSLTPEQVRESSELTDGKIIQKLELIRKNIETRRNGLFESGKPVVREGMDALDKIINEDGEDLMMKMSWIDDVTQKDWAKFQSLREDSEAWQTKYMALHKGTSNNKQLKAVSADVPKAISSLNTDLDDHFAGFRVRLGMLKRAAYDRIEAREALQQLSLSKSRASSSSSSRSSSTSTTATPGRVSILPIAEAGAAAVAAAGIIGKGRDQVIDALHQASAAALGSTPSASGVVKSAKSIASDLSSSASSVYDAASSSVHQATRSAIYAVGATPSPETPSEHVESVFLIVSDSASSVASVASESASSIGSLVAESASSLASVISASVESISSEASSTLHQASRSVISAVGATPSPETFAETVESLVAVASGSAESLASVASASLHSATRAASRAVGATPSPESLGEHIESIGHAANSVASVVSQSASSVISIATEPVVSILNEGSMSSLASVATESAGSVISVASEAIHSGTRSLSSILRATPTPETPREHLESVYAKVSSVASPAGSVISTLSSSVESLLGLEPTATASDVLSSASSIASSMSSGASSIVSEVVESGKSLGSEAGKSLHSVTRSLSRAAGVRPTPESVGEYVEDVKAKVGRALGRDEL